MNSTPSFGSRTQVTASLREQPAEPFSPPQYPYDRLEVFSALAEQLPGGAVDCSVGTPCDPPPASAVRALGISGTERGYPVSAGGPAFRRAATEWMRRRFDISIDPSEVVGCVGTKEFVASLPHFMRLRNPTRDTVLYPAVSYPSYAMGAILAGCRALPVPPLTSDGAGLDLSRVRTSDITRALLLWSNSPSNPTGSLGDLNAQARWGRLTGVPVFSDECYCEFTWEEHPQSILEYGSEGVVAVHSLSKRSNLAGVRAGFFAGDGELVSYLREVRRHAGLMIPGPVQAAAAVALADDEHVEAQRVRYRERLEFMAESLTSFGCPATLPAGGFYLWVRVPARWNDAWELAADLAKVGGLLVSPGDLYGEGGMGYIRIAVVQPMVRLRLAVDRLSKAGWPDVA